jgi:non-specific protein-tyrosine kinase
VEILQFGRVLRRWAWLIILFGLIAAVTAAAISYELPRTYEATTVALVNPKQLFPADVNAISSLPSDALVETYSRLITANPVYKKLIADGLPRTEDQLTGEITTKVEPNTTLIDITIKDSDPAVTQRIAEDIIPAFNSSLSELQSRVATPGSTTQQLEGLVPWQVPSHPPTTPVSPRTSLNILIALVAGIGLGVGFAFLLEYLDNTVKTELDVRQRLDQNLLGPVLYKPSKKRALARRDAQEEVALVTVTQPKEPVSEAYRAIRTNLLFTSTERKLRTLVVTSAIPGEGKTSTACNLAVVMAQAGNRVVLVDADFRRPQIHKVFHKSNVGLGNLILGDLAEEDLVVRTQVPNLSVVCSGPTPPNPSELLGSIRMQGVMERLQQVADIVIFDTPPVGAVTDATVLASRTDGVVLVVERGRTDVHNITRAIDKLKSVRANLLGVVLNKIRVSEATESYYYRYYTETPRQGKSPNGNGNGNGKVARKEALAAVPLATPLPPTGKPDYAAQAPVSGARLPETAPPQEISLPRAPVEVAAPTAPAVPPASTQPSATVPAPIQPPAPAPAAPVPSPAPPAPVARVAESPAPAPVEAVVQPPVPAPPAPAPAPAPAETVAQGTAPVVGATSPAAPGTGPQGLTWRSLQSQPQPSPRSDVLPPPHGGPTEGEDSP